MFTVCIFTGSHFMFVLLYSCLSMCYLFLQMPRHTACNPLSVLYQGKPPQITLSNLQCKARLPRLVSLWRRTLSILDLMLHVQAPPNSHLPKTSAWVSSTLQGGQ